jgi:hypothetical protein
MKHLLRHITIASFILAILCFPIAAQQPQTITGRVVGVSDFAQEHNQQTKQQVSDLLRKIYDDGDLPKEWDNLSDKEVELEIYKLTGRDGKPPEGWENWSKLVTPQRQKITDRNIGVGCFVEFTAKVKKKDFDTEVLRILTTYGGVLMHVTDDPFHRGFWVRDIGDIRAEEISQDPQVRRVYTGGLASEIWGVPSSPR